ncbi:MAG: glycosyltransferase [Bacteroidota bacterium]|nr:glycosyltransferase [Bacteroidota bacterium]
MEIADVALLLFGTAGVLVFPFLAVINARMRQRCEQRSTATGSLSVTVVIAAHNEASRIERLVRCLSRQSRPMRNPHVILVDDRSDDGTAERARAAVGNGLCLEIIRIDTTPPGVSPKKWALHCGISATETDIVLLTDADCMPEPMWVEGMLQAFETGADIVCGLSPMTDGKGFTGAYAEYETARTAVQYVSAARLGVPYMAVGRNWGFRRALYERCAGLAPLFTTLGGDDDLLFQRMLTLEPKVTVVTRRGTRCPTTAPHSFRAMLRRKLRHFRVSMRYAAGPRTALALLTICEWTALVFLPLYLAMVSHAPLLFAAWVVFKPVWDTTFLGPTLRECGLERGGVTELAYTAFLGVFHLVFSSVVGLVSFIVKPRW